MALHLERICGGLFWHECLIIYGELVLAWRLNYISALVLEDYISALVMEDYISTFVFWGLGLHLRSCCLEAWLILGDLDYEVIFGGLEHEVLAWFDTWRLGQC